MTSSAILSRSAKSEPAGGFGPVATLPPGAVRLVGGAPAAEALLTGELAAAFTTALAGATALQYSVAPGIEPLRGWIAEHELSGADRARAVALAGRYGFLVISDNPYRSLRFAGAEVPDLPLDSEAVVRVNTFSQTLGPGLRSGWIAAPEWLLPVLTRLRANVDQHSSLLTQTALAGVLTVPGFFDGVLRTARELYRERSGVLTAALRSRLGERVAFDVPEGGIFLWMRATEPALDLVALRERARALGVEFALGRYFDPEGAGGHTDRIRLGFSNASGADIELGVERIAAAWVA
ncbi:PLP-dependent aminotransferase family protein [Nocardia sp. NPDC050697]|uniref:PLP-dependent aminotransferase family protein n=1 Tax=Nocardia sp. NPDC050697 TaxID=3155158 RepID=UPI0033EDE660